ncbi:hypothetical protein ACFQE1_00105 [Halobium palmae]|uniref:DUF6788 domain-containing protein n=1 Tax=Halobium palmae TaxID=1776492 RepID=A0ABD5RTT9_9EURY
MSDVPESIEARLEELTPGQLDQVARLAERLAEDQRRQQRIEETEATDVDQKGDPLPEGVPGKATLTKKTINDNEYWYWQWREGDSIKSQYKGPVNEG